MDVDLVTVKRMARLFSGYQKAHGRYRADKSAGPNGKVNGRASTVEGPAGEQEWREHLNGSGPGIGGIPLREDNTCLFAAIDVDAKEYPDIDAAAEARRCAKLNIPVVVCRSKSGSAHIYAFFSMAIPASEVRKAMHSLAATLGFGGVEIFPKQETRTSAEDKGNWINLPYYDASSSPRPALGEDGSVLSLMQFLDLAESRRIADVSVLLGSEPEGDLFTDGPPCLQRIAGRGGFPDGTRNEGMFSVGVYLKQRFPDDWQSKLSEYNGRLCHPALPPEDVSTIAKSVGRKDYNYKCKQSPLKPVCDRRLCITRRYGIGSSPESGGVEITAITKYPSTPVLWCIEVGGLRIEMGTDELLNHKTFTRICAEKMSKLPSPVNQAKWLDYLRPKLESCDEVPPPEDTSEEEQFRLYVERWVTGTSQAQTLDELLLDKPFRKDGKVYFLSESLKKKMDGDHYKYGNMHRVWNMLRNDLHAQQSGGVNLRGGKFRRPWTIDDPSMDDVDVGKGIETTIREEF